MIPVIIIASILVVLFLLIRFVPLHLVLILDGDALRVQLRYLVFRFHLYPSERSKKKKTAKKPKAEQKQTSGTKSNHSLTSTLDLIGRLFRLLREKLSRKIRIHIRKLRIVVATGDPASCAILYGTVTQSVSYLIELLQSLFYVTQKKNAISVQADFLAARSSLNADIAVSVTLFRILQFFIAFLLGKRKSKNQSKLPISNQ